jgi:hypothetical protein
MLNPSTADDRVDDPTIRRCVALAKRWGFGAIDVVNLFAWRGTREALRQLGPGRAAGGRRNDRELGAALGAGARIVLAWGTDRLLVGAIRRRALVVRAIFVASEAAIRSAPPFARRQIGRATELDVGHLGCNRDGSPKHPLYLPNSTRFVPIAWRDPDSWPLTMD